MAGAVQVRGAKVHNLRDLDVDIPLGKLVVITGVSGSGKTSLALDTLAAEGTRRYLETFPVHARRLLPRPERPVVRSIDHLPAALAIGQYEPRASARGNVARASGLWDYLRLLYGQWSIPYCGRCGVTVDHATAESVAAELTAQPPDTAITIAVPIILPEKDLDPARREWLAEGAARIEWRGTIYHLERDKLPRDMLGENARLVVDRLRADSGTARLLESLETAFRRGSGRVELEVNGRWLTRFSDYRCSECGQEFLPPTPELFRADGAGERCPMCAGRGGPPASAKVPRSERSSCSACGGSGIDPSILLYRFQDQPLLGVLARPIDEVLAWLRARVAVDSACRLVLEELIRRCEYLQSVGLGYLSLHRWAGSLSVGEARRVELTSALGAALSHMLLVADEPSAGLHPSDSRRLLDVLEKLRDRHNSVILVEHDRELILGADHVIDMGPGAGSSGGDVVFAGPPAELMTHATSRTAAALRGELGPKRHRRQPSGWLRLEGARANNLRDVDVEFPLGCLCVVTGVSGAGKSSLVFESLLPALLGESNDRYRRIDPGGIEDVAVIEPSGLGRTTRAIPATYLKFFDEIRGLFAETSEARLRGLTAADFSFNSGNGRCRRCEGTGEESVELRFLPDVTLPCPECGGTRYGRRVLEVKYRGKNCAEVLALSAREAFGFFHGLPRVQRGLALLRGVGLDYLPLGQSLATLSGGEAQRLLLAARLGPRTEGSALLLIDEPTVGLHPADIAVLIQTFDSLLDAGNSFVVIEHDPELVGAADWVIELGPGAGPAGGRILGAGPGGKN